MADTSTPRSHARALADAAAALADRIDPHLTPRRVCELAVELVAPCTHASISVRGRRARPQTLAASSDLARELDALQFELGEGPSLTAIDEDRTIACQDLAVDGAWPAWIAAAGERGIHSLLSIRLMNGRGTVGSMTLYSTGTQGWDDETRELAKLYATHAAIAMQHDREADGLNTALASRHLIGLAQGVLMNQHRLSATQAFAVLQQYSSESNVKVADVAREIVADIDPGYTPPA